MQSELSCLLSTLLPCKFPLQQVESNESLCCVSDTMRTLPRFTMIPILILGRYTRQGAVEQQSDTVHHCNRLQNLRLRSAVTIDLKIAVVTSKGT